MVAVRGGRGLEFVAEFMVKSSLGSLLTVCRRIKLDSLASIICHDE